MIDKLEMAAKLRERLDMPALIRLGVWGMCAVLAVAAAVVAAHSQLSIRSTTQAAAPPPDPARLINAPQLLSRVNEIDAEGRRLAESIRLLGVDNDRLTARVSVLERNLEGLTGSIAPAPQAAARPAANENLSPPPSTSAPVDSTSTLGPAAPPARPPMSLAPPQAAAAPPPPAADASSPRAARMAMIESYARAKPDPSQLARATASPDSPADSVVTATDFGVDLGGATSVNGLRALWISLKAKHAQLLNGLWPVMSVHDRAKPGVVDLRLVAGPLPDASLAARLCASFAGLGVACQPAVFDGQRLALR